MKRPYTPAPPQTDRFPLTQIVVTGAIALLVFAGASWVAFSMYRAYGHAASAPVEVGQPEISGVIQVPFESNSEAQHLKAQQEARLRSYGWVNRSQGTIHIPIDVAIERYVVRHQEGSR